MSNDSTKLHPWSSLKNLGILKSLFFTAVNTASRIPCRCLVNPVGFRNPLRPVTCVDFPRLVSLIFFLGLKEPPSHGRKCFSWEETATPYQIQKCSLLLQTEVIRKRLHKDIPHHSVIMLNFCPDLQSVQPNLRKTHGEFLFLVDRSSSVSRTSIQCVKVLCVGPSTREPGLKHISCAPRGLSVPRSHLFKISLSRDTLTQFVPKINPSK